MKYSEVFFLLSLLCVSENRLLTLDAIRSLCASVFGRNNVIQMVISEFFKASTEKLNSVKTVSYTHLDVYKRQVHPQLERSHYQDEYHISELLTIIL